MPNKDMNKKKKLSPLQPNYSIDYFDIDLLKLYMTKFNKIRPRRTTNLTLKQQRKISKAIKRARHASLIPFVINK